MSAKEWIFQSSYGDVRLTPGQIAVFQAEQADQGKGFTESRRAARSLALELEAKCRDNYFDRLNAEREERRKRHEAAVERARIRRLLAGPHKPERLARIIRLRDEERMPFSAIARDVGLSPSRVSDLYHRHTPRVAS